LTAVWLLVVPLVCCCLEKNTLGAPATVAAFEVAASKLADTSCHGTAASSSHQGSPQSQFCGCLKFIGALTDNYLTLGKQRFRELLVGLSRSVLSFELLAGLRLCQIVLRGTSFSSSPPIQLSSVPLYLKNSILQI
jgi:hypothetical protein